MDAPSPSFGRWLPRPPAAMWESAAVGLFAAMVYGLHGFDGRLDRDLGVFVYGGERVAHGVPPYVGNFNTVGPLADLVPGAAIFLGRPLGIGPVLAPRLLSWVLSALCCSLLYLLARTVTRSRAAGVLSVSLFLPFACFLNLATDGPREKTVMVLFLLAALLQLSRRRFGTAGILTGLATLTWQPALLPLVAGAVVAAWMAPRRVRSLALFVAGGAAAAAAAAAAFAAAGALHRALEAFLVANILWVHQPSAFSNPHATWHLLWHGYGVWVVTALLGPLVLAVIVARRREPALAPTAAAGVVALAWTAAVVNGAPDLFVVLPFAAFGTALLVWEIAGRLRSCSPRFALTLVAAACAAAVIAAAATAVTTRNDRLLAEVRDARMVLRSAPAGAAMAAINAPEPLALSKRVNPTPFLVLASGEVGYLDHNVRGGYAGYLRRLVRRQTPLLAVGRAPDAPLIRQLLRRDYRAAGPGPAWHWWVARDLGRQVDRRVKLAAAAAMRSPKPTA